MTIVDLRKEYHRRICTEIIRITRDAHNARHPEYPNFADGGSVSSVAIASNIVKRLKWETGSDVIAGQTAGGRFEDVTKGFLEQAFEVLHHLRPGVWRYSTQRAISLYDQYSHLAALKRIIEEHEELASALRTDYIVTPDIVVSRLPVSDEEINKTEPLLNSEDNIAKLTPLRQLNLSPETQLLHASISCKWTIRSDRVQNARLEASNLIRNRKGNLPHVVAVVGEPLPTRIASLALGTGDLDCVYHFALYELVDAVQECSEDQLDVLKTLIEGRRLRDISDLPFDLAV